MNASNVIIESELSSKTINFNHDTHGEKTFFKHEATTKGTMHQIVSMKEAGTAMAASDGSVKHGIGSASWIITGNANLTSEYQGSHGVPPSHAPMTSHRAELYGIDEKKRPLTWPEKLNCRMDKKAKQMREYICTTPHYEYSTIHLQHQWTLLMHGKIVSQDIGTAIKNHHYLKIMSDHLINNKMYHPMALQLIHWDAIEKATLELPHFRQIWATKFVSGFCGVAEKMNERQQWESNLCPLCQVNSENAMHVVKCKDHRAIQKYEKLLQQLHAWLDAQMTHPDIIITIITTLSATNISSFTTNLPPLSDKHCHTAAQHQDLIGQENMFKGHIAESWKDAQFHHLKFRGEEHCTSKSVTWAKNLVLRLYNFSFEMWDHRNQIVHTKIEDQLNKIQSETLKRQIQEVYLNEASELKENDKILLEEGLQKTLEKTVREKRAWLASVDSSKQYKLHSQTNMYTNMRRSMQQWLTS